MTSLRAHIGQLRQYLSERPSVKLFAIEETHLDARTTNEQIGIENFSLIRFDRNSEGGGLALYVHNTFSKP